MTLVFQMSCSKQHARLHQLADGRFQIVEEGGLAPLLIGYDYVLVEEDLAQYLITLGLPQFEVVDAIIYEPWQKQEIRTHKQLLIDRRFSADMIKDMHLDGEQFLLMDRQYVFVTGPLRERLQTSRFKYLRFTEGLTDFAGNPTRIRPESDDWRPDGKKILSAENLAVIERTLEDHGPIIVEHWHYRGARAPDRIIFDDIDEFIAYVETKSVIGDAFHVWSFAEVCRDENEIANGKVPDAEGCVPTKGAY